MSIPALVTLPEVKRALALLHDTDDPLLEELIVRATDIIIDYLKKPEDEWTAETVPERVKNAIILLVGRLYADREATFEGGLLNQAIRDLIWRNRDPALA